MKARKIILFVLMLAFVFCFTAANAQAQFRSAAYGKSYGYGSWVELSTSFKVIYSMTFSTPVTAYGYIDCDGYAAIHNCELQVAMGIDSTSEQASTRRFYSYPTGATDTSGIHTSRLWKFNPGTHTVYFLARVSYTGTGWYSRANYMSISVLLFEKGGYKAEEALEVEPGLAPDGLPE